MNLRDDYRQLLDRYSLPMRMSRVICILGMVYVHINMFSEPSLQGTTYFVVLQSILVEFFGRASVPLLSVLSGFLMFGYFSRRSYFEALRARALVLLLPLAVWNSLGLGLDFVRGEEINLTPNLVIPIWGDGFYPALNFLRDLFLVSAATPILVLLLRRYHWYGLAAIIVAALFLDFAPVLMRNQILMYYSIGLFVAMYRLGIENHLRQIRFIALAGAVVLVLAIASEAIFVTSIYSALPPEVFDELLRRPIGALSFWFVAIWLARLEFLRTFLARHIEPAIFLLFLSHSMSEKIFGSVYASLQFWHTPGIYALVWLMVPFACLAVAVAGTKVLPHLPKFVAYSVAGKA